jgi:hypothetical protein
MKALLISTGLIVFAAISAAADTPSTTQYFVVLAAGELAPDTLMASERAIAGGA